VADRARGQAFTLEGFVSGIVLLTAVLLALQAVTVPPSGGSADRSATIQQQAEDIMRSQASADRDLTHAVRYYDSLRRKYVDAQNAEVGYGNRPMPAVLFDRSFERAFGDRGLSYNVVVVYHRPNETAARGRLPMVYQGAPSENAVTARHTAALYDSMTLTGPGTNTRSLAEYDTNATDNDGGYYPIPDAVDGPLYNVVEIEVTVW
jgi:hypothetical protein